MTEDNRKPENREKWHPRASAGGRVRGGRGYGDGDEERGRVGFWGKGGVWWGAEGFKEDSLWGGDLEKLCCLG